MTRQELLAIAKPMLFNTEMMRANLENRKTETRRVIKYSCPTRPENTLDDFIGDSDPQLLVGCASYKTGDFIYARETWCELLGVAGRYFYRAYAGEVDADKEYCHSQNKWRPSIHMPKGAARWFARVKAVRAERVQDMDISACVREGVTWKEYPYAWTVMAKPAFINLWDSTQKPVDLPLYGWDANPWVWVIEYERVILE